MAHDTHLKEIDVKLSAAHVARLSRCPPIEAISEIVWNSLDASATVVKIIVRRNDLGGIETVEITDNGEGIVTDDLDANFGSLGESLKLNKGLNSRSRPIHGHLGEGRFKAFTLGSPIEWKTRNVKESREISGKRESSNKFSSVNANIQFATKTGTKFTAYNDLGADLKIPQDEALAKKLASVFAPTLLADNKIQITVGDVLVDPSSMLQFEETIYLDAKEPDLQLKIVVWKSGHSSEFHWCDENLLSRVEENSEADTDLPHSLFLSSKKIGASVRDNSIEVRELTDLKNLKAAALLAAKKRFDDISKRLAADTIETLKSKKIYPYDEEPKTEYEKVERKVFDVCTVKIMQSMPSIAGQPKDSQKLTLALLKQTLENSPSDLKRVLEKVLKLPKDEVKKLSELLDRVTFEGLIQLGKTVSSRLDFISGLEQLTLDPFWKKTVKERTQLHKIIENETWIFGEQYALGTSDERLSGVLEYHREILGHDSEEFEAPNSSDMIKIPDIVLGRQFRDASGERYEHLVIELKRPSVKIGLDEKVQIEKYASIISRNTAFDKSKTRWRFVAVSSDVTDDVEQSRHQANREYGQIFVAGDGSYEIYVKTWGEIIQSARGRMEHLKAKLNIDSSRKTGMEYLRGSYPELMKDIEAVAPDVE